MDDHHRAADDPCPQPSENTQNSERIDPKHKWYRNFVTFAAILMGVSLVIFLTLDGLGSVVQNTATSLIKPHPEQPGMHTISVSLARGLALCLSAIGLGGIWICWELMRAKRAIRALRDQNNANLLADSTPSAPTTNRSTERELARIHKQFEQQRTVLKKIQSQMYEDNVRPRHDFVSFRALYVVAPNGDIDVEKEVILTSQELEVHFWRFFANGEQFAMPLADESEMELQVRALDDGRTECIPLLVDNKSTRKEFTVNFLPAITPGTQRAFLLKYRWPGFLRELVQTGRTNYFWESKAFTNGGIADFAVEWRFDRNFGDVACETTRENPAGMSLEKTQRHPGTKWVYAGSRIPLGNLPLELSFSCEMDGDGP